MVELLTTILKDRAERKTSVGNIILARETLESREQKQRKHSDSWETAGQIQKTVMFVLGRSETWSKDRASPMDGLTPCKKMRVRKTIRALQIEEARRAVCIGRRKDLDGM